MHNHISSTIAHLRLPLIIMVVFIHCLGSPSDTTIHWDCLAGDDWFNILRVTLSRTFCHVCNPTFFFIAGYLFFAKMKESNWAFYKKQWTRRLRTLLIPYILWNCIQFFLAPAAKMVKTRSLGAAADYLALQLTPNAFWAVNSEGGG